MRKLLVVLMILLNLNVSGQSSVNEWLNTRNGKLSARINQYNKEQYNLLINQEKFNLEKGKQIRDFQQSTWEITSDMVLSKGESADFSFRFKCTRGNLKAASLSIDLDFSNWSEKNYVLFPSAVYDGNRYQWRRLRYSPKLHDIKDIGPDKPIIINDVPKLSENGGVSRIQERSGSMSTPSIGFISDATKKGIWLLCQQGNNLGDYGMDIAENRDRSGATISITSPVVREQYLYKMCDARFPSWDLPKDFREGDEVTIAFGVYAFDAPETQSIFDKFAEIRKEVVTDHQLVSTLPFSECMKTLENKFNEKNFVQQFGYYSVGMRENYLQDWQIGWTGGMISTYPLLFSGDQKTKENVIRNFDWLFPNGISPSGFYWDAGQKGTEWIGGDIRNQHTKNWHLIRKSGDAVWYIIKQFTLMEQLNIPVKSEWKEGNRRVCDAFVKLWNKYHQLGQFVDSQTGEIIVGGSSGGAIVPAALALASKYYGIPEYLETAKEIGAYFNENFTKKGISCGGPGDALQNFDSESSYALVESYLALFEATKEKKWLTTAENAAKQYATWVVSYNYQYPENTAFYKAKIHTTGGVCANIQNKHSAPGICTASGLGLLQLFRYTGDKFYIELLRDIAHNMPQYLSHPLKPFGNAPFGYVSERVNMTDWEGPESIGYILPISTWAETSLMLTAIEIPGLYVQPDKSYFAVFDNLEVKVISDTRRELVLQLENSTPVEAVVSIMEENSNQIDKGSYELPATNLKKVSLKSGEKKKIAFKKK
ncbi:MAG: hypothetical protein ACOYM0_15890 [Bacteroidales bacterium]